jgi:hypothetical protein
MNTICGMLMVFSQEKRVDRIVSTVDPTHSNPSNASHSLDELI